MRVVIADDSVLRREGLSRLLAEVGCTVVATAGTGEEAMKEVALNHPDVVVACLGAMRLGAIWLGINRAWAPPEKAYLIGDAEPSVTLADPAMTDQLRDLGRTAPRSV